MGLLVQHLYMCSQSMTLTLLQLAAAHKGSLVPLELTQLCFMETAPLRLFVLTLSDYLRPALPKRTLKKVSRLPSAPNFVHEGLPVLNLPDSKRLWSLMSLLLCPSCSNNMGSNSSPDCSSQEKRGHRITPRSLLPSPLRSSTFFTSSMEIEISNGSQCGGFPSIKIDRVPTLTDPTLPQRLDVIHSDCFLLPASSNHGS